MHTLSQVFIPHRAANRGRYLEATCSLTAYLGPLSSALHIAEHSTPERQRRRVIWGDGRR